MYTPCPQWRWRIFLSTFCPLDVKHPPPPPPRSLVSHDCCFTPFKPQPWERKSNPTPPNGAVFLRDSWGLGSEAGRLESGLGGAGEPVRGGSLPRLAARLWLLPSWPLVRALAPPERAIRTGQDGAACPWGLPPPVGHTHHLYPQPLGGSTQ